MKESNEYGFIAPATLVDDTYQIIKLIGKGGMGTVYMAYDVRLDRKVALKVISPDFAENMDRERRESLMKRFESEARIAAKIDHPNVIRIYGFKKETLITGGTAHEIDYLVMELLAQRTLRNTMDVSGFEYEEEIRDWIAKYMVPILDGLQTVHERGIIHRDLKPENFFMKDDTPKLADFGLSMGRDLPSVTASVADIYGTVAYMAPEQFYNFSLAREAADIYSLGKILYEVVEGRISDKVKPFKQMRLSNHETDFLEPLNDIIMKATAENPNDRIASAGEFRERLMELIYCKTGDRSKTSDRRKPLSRRPGLFRTGKFIWPALMMLVLVLVLTAAVMLFMHDPFPTSPADVVSPQVEKIPVAVQYQPYPDHLEKSGRAPDNSILHLIPPAEIDVPEGMDGVLESGKRKIDAFYMTESPVTNQQFVAFLNRNLDRIRVVESEVYFDDVPVLRLSEKIRGYKPIVFDGKRFLLKEPMHAACAVLLVTGYGAEAYAASYGMRLPAAEEWYYVMTTGGKADTGRIEVPTPVINYEKDRYGLRGINQLAEWGRIDEDTPVIVGQVPSDMIESELIIEKDMTKYYTDTGFRLSKNAE